MAKIPLYFQDKEFYNEFGTSCYINHEQMIDVFPLYRHDFVEISLILEGRGTELCNNKKYDVQAGSVSVTMPWHFHTLSTSPDQPITRFICEFSLEDYLHYASVWEPARRAIFDHTLEHVVLLNEYELKRTCNIFNEMYACFTDTSDPDRQDLLYLKLIEFMMIFYRAQKRESASLPQSSSFSLDAPAAQILRYIHQNFASDLSPQATAREMGLSVSSLKDLLIDYTGQDFYTLLTDIRLRNACVLLGLKTPTIRYIAQNTGFGSIQTFYRIFKEKKGVTPDEFRKKHWAESEGKAGYLMYNNEIWQLLYYIHLHFDEEITPETTAQALGISTSYLHKIVKYNLMQTFSELLREIRISYSCGLLSNPDLTIEQIAIESGYNNSKTFTRAFQSQKGCTPTEYRLANKKTI